MYIINSKNQTGIFSNENPFVFFQNKISFMKTYLNLVCECIWYTWAIHQLFYHLHFNLKQNLNKTNLDTSLDLVGLHLKSSHLLDLVQTWYKELYSSWVLDVVLMHRLLNQTVLAPKLDFKSFVEAMHLLRSWSQIWD